MTKHNEITILKRKPTSLPVYRNYNIGILRQKAAQYNRQEENRPEDNCRGHEKLTNYPHHNRNNDSNQCNDDWQFTSVSIRPCSAD